jgi:hypothetical protein
MIHCLSETSFFTGVVADEAADGRQGIDLPDQFQSLCKLPPGDEGGISSGILVNGAGFLTGWGGGLILRGHLVHFLLVKSSPQAGGFPAILWNEFRRTPPNTNLTLMTAIG